MDGYVTKPFRRAALFEALAAVVPVPATGSEEQMTGFDLEAALAIVEGNRSLLAEMARLFEQEGTEHLGALLEAIRRRDPAGVALYAHALKGALNSLGAVAAADAAWRLEQLAKADDKDRFDEAAVALENELSRAQPYLASLLAQEAAT
jgi:HPt (histidine-containing phosphotransfer) domain-containing protein